MTTPPLGIYRHYKGNLYQLLHIARHSETEEPLAVYRALYGDYGVWVRPLAMFTESVDTANGSLKTGRVNQRLGFRLLGQRLPPFRGTAAKPTRQPPTPPAPQPTKLRAKYPSRGGTYDWSPITPA